jgi:glycosyltransferase involved in cell wall biosynthesis
MKLPRPSRIAIVTETFPPDLNGVSMSLCRLVEGLIDRGHTVDVHRVRAGGAGGEWSSRDLEERGTVRIYYHPSVPIPAYPDLRVGLPSGRRLERIWSLTRPDVVHIATEGPLGWSAIRAARRMGLPVSSDFRTNFDGYSAHYKLSWLAKPIGAWLRAFHNRTDLTTVPTSALRDELSSRGFRRLRVLGRGVDASLFNPRHRDETLRESWGATPGCLVALCVGRLAPEKNLELAIQAFEAIRKGTSSARLIFVGDGPMRSDLQARCPDAVFAGRQTGVDLARHYASADLFLFPSLSETFGNVVTEAMASGLATVAFQHAAAAELIVTGRSGVAVSPGAAGDFIASASSLAADGVTRRVMCREARAAVEHLHWPAIATQFEGLIEALINGERPVHPTISPPRVRASSVRAI